MVSTTHFLKKSIMVPLTTLDNGVSVEPKNTQHPFMRGIMQFDDYNYGRFNGYILVPQPKESSKMKKYNSVPNLLTKAYLEGKEPIPLSDKNIERLESDINAKFFHDAINTGGEQDIPV